jgi:hypothetical protein
VSWEDYFEEERLFGAVYEFNIVALLAGSHVDLGRTYL